jgi:hypothetical protein
MFHGAGLIVTDPTAPFATMQSGRTFIRPLARSVVVRCAKSNGVTSPFSIYGPACAWSLSFPFLFDRWLGFLIFAWWRTPITVTDI